MGDFLGTGRVADYLRVFISYNKLKKIVRDYKVESISQYQRFCLENQKLIEKLNIPKHPNRTYKNKGWKNWGEFLGTGRVADQLKKNLYYDFEKAKNYINKLNIKTSGEWKKYSKNKRPYFIPGSPDRIYKKQWKGWSDFLGNKSN